MPKTKCTRDSTGTGNRVPFVSPSFKLRLLDARFQEPGIGLLCLRGLGTQDSQDDGPLGPFSDAIWPTSRFLVPRVA